MAVLTGVSNVGVVATAAAADNYSFSNVNANTAFTVTGAGQAATSLNIALKDSSGLSDSTTVKLGDATETAAVGVTLSSLTDVAGAETVNIVSLGSSNATTNTLSTTAVAGKLVITGDASFTLGAVTASTQVDASGLKGVFTVGSGTPYAIDGGNIQSGSGNDVITAGAGAQTINGGAGNDTITGGAGADLITGGTGADTFVTGAAGASVAASANTLNGTIANGQTLTFGNGVDVITDFVSGTDKLDVATAATVATSGIGLAANTDLATDTTYTILGTYNAATKVFTVDSTATSSTANVATLLVVGDAGALTFQDTTGYTVLVGVASTAAADFV
jgi:Ca2+-binding RTX toxin-like protein